MKQFGFAIRLDGGRQLAFAGDEPLSERASREFVNYDWLMHEAICLYEERDISHPYEKYHSTVKDVCESAERMGEPFLSRMTGKRSRSEEWEIR